MSGKPDYTQDTVTPEQQTEEDAATWVAREAGNEAVREANK